VIYSQGDTDGDSIGKLWIVPVEEP